MSSSLISGERLRKVWPLRVPRLVPLVRIPERVSSGEAALAAVAALPLRMRRNLTSCAPRRSRGAYAAAVATSRRTHRPPDRRQERRSSASMPC
jgi:hypothetical protein